MTILVTGGGGFLGLAIVRQLIARRDRVRNISRNRHPALDELGVEQVQGDLGDLDALMNAAQGCDAVMHVAAKAGVWGPWREYYETNVVGTRNLLDACRRMGVKRLVYTSSPSVVFTGRDEAGIDESAPYAERFLTHYPRTKAEAERLVLAANGPDLATVALRPHLIWGPGDNHLIPRLIDRARRGKLRRIGDGKNIVDAVFVDNAADAHLLALDRLHVGSPIAGKAYFITNGEPVNLWEFINRLLAVHDLPPVTKSMPAGLAYVAGAMMEVLWKILPLSGEPPMTRFVARQLSTSHWYNLAAARRDLGYEPRVSIEQGMDRLKESLTTNLTN